MQMIPLKAVARSSDARANVLRAKGTVPCTLYGNEVKPTNLQCDHGEIYKAYAKAGESVLVELDAGGSKVPVLFYEVQFAPVSGNIVHVDFYAVNMNKEIEASIPLNFIGEAPAIKELGGIVVHVHNDLTVTCLPKDLPQHLDVDISSLAAFGDALHVSDVKLPKGVAVQEAADEMVVVIQEPREEKIEEPAAGVEGAEGAAAPAEGAEGPAEGAPEAQKAPEKSKEKSK